MTPSPEPRFVRAAGPRVYRHLGGEQITVLLSGAETGGAFALILDVSPPGAGPPLHVHANEEETFYILEGEVDIQLADERLTARPGDTVHVPRGVPHTFRNSGDRASRTLALVSPAGLEGFFGEVEPLLPEEGEPDMDAVLAAAAKYGITAVGPPLGPRGETP